MNSKITTAELKLRHDKIRALMSANNIGAVLISTNTNIYYCAGRVFNGFVYIPAEGETLFFVRRPAGLTDKNVIYIKKPEQITEELSKLGITLPENVALELDRISFSDTQRLTKALSIEKPLNASPLISSARAVKTAVEIELIKEAGVHHCNSYKRIPSLFRKGMTDIELQTEIEYDLRKEGCLGLFRVAGESMESFMGHVITGDNADNPSPYDFAMGGAGMDESLPMGCNGSTIEEGSTVMIDMNGNFNGYMTDITRTYGLHLTDAHTLKAHQLSVDIHKALIRFIKPGVAAKDAYLLAQQMVEEAGETDYFMGHRQKAGFIGHGLGIEINEWPVLAPRSKHIFEEGNVIAIEPKFVIPGIGAAGIENTYVVTAEGLECITPLPEDIIELK